MHKLFSSYPKLFFFYFKDHGLGKALINFHLVCERPQFYDRSRISSEILIADDAPFLVLILAPISWPTPRWRFQRFPNKLVRHQYNDYCCVQ